MRSKSISVTLTCAIVGFLALLVVVSASAITGLATADRRLESVDRTWLVGIELLGDLRNGVARYRAAESDRALATDQRSVAQAESLAERHAAAVEEIASRYSRLVLGGRHSDDLAAFRWDWATYLDQHHAWIAEAAGEATDKPLGRGSLLQARYEAVQRSVDTLIDEARLAANGETAAADDAAKWGIGMVASLATLAGLLAVGLLGFVERHVTTPLGAITGALTRLANGHRDTQVPELHRRDEIGAMATAFEVFRGNAVALAEAQERAEGLARHDALTGLPNRRFFASELDLALRACHQEGTVTSVMLVDLDRFKPVNDLHGHAAGDNVLCEIATRLRTLVGAEGMVARLGGDEFAIILPAVSDRRTSADAAIQLAGRIVAAASEPIPLAQTRIVLGASIGISLCPSDGQNAEDVLRTADMAMYRAKHDGRGMFRFFEASMDEELRTRARIESDIRLALARNEIQPHYQPLVDLSSDRIAGFEVLARWHRPGEGFVPPDTFIPIIEQLGLLDDLTASILTQALRDARQWHSQIRLAVNISPAQFQDVQFPVRLAALLMAEGFLPQRLEIEVTETALIGNLVAARSTLDALRGLGVRVVLDDFGTGYSSLSHLREFRFDKIKIDRSFIGSLHENEDSRTIVDAVLGLARNLGLPTVAEGIEDCEVRNRLASRGCEFGQGYWFSKAVPADLATDMLNGEVSASRVAMAG